MVATLKAQLPELSGSELALALTAVSHGRCSSPGLKEAVAQTMAAGLLRARGFRHPFDSAPTASCLLSLARLGAGEEGWLARELLHPSLTTLGSSATSTLLPPG
ncbi:hypothetical protein HaLaN_14299 [Haematococcus lacustris]|uniref:Uncharacterized protein n=1 Tax=Haematococcus lacustris TaxID=44745 RepID=A0A699ZFJ9_HAELA|nr:hypothetical protein HaLaN_14299 [Haematococcus lacustris]